MKKLKILILTITTITFFSCTKEECTDIFDGITYSATYAPMSSLRNVSIGAPKQVNSYGKIFIKGNYIFLNEVDKGFHIIDNTNPSLPINIAFVYVPGNLDLIGKGNYLFADSYVDLLTFDISNPANIILSTRKENAVPFRNYNYGFSDNASDGIIIGFTKKIERKELKCGSISWRCPNCATGTSVFIANSSSSLSISPISSNNGQSGSLSRFALVNNYLYVANRYSLTPVDISNPLQPVEKPLVYTGEQETIYPFNGNLFIGTPNGLNIYGLTNPAIPNYLSTFRHWRGCDPVVVNNNTAYVTVRNNGRCGGEINELDILDVSNINTPVLLKKYNMQNPFGLGFSNNKLGICDGLAGFKLYNAFDYNNLQLTSTINLEKTYDVIMNNQSAIIVAADGLYQYNIDSSNPILLSKIPILKQ